MPNSWGHPGKTTVKKPDAIQGLLIGTEGERSSGIVQYPSETTPGMLHVILIWTAKKPHKFEKFQMGASAEKGCKKVIHWLETTEHKKFFI